MKLFYREWGRGEPLLILHGLYGCSDNWMTIARKLAERFQVIAVDFQKSKYLFYFRHVHLNDISVKSHLTNISTQISHATESHPAFD